MTKFYHYFIVIIFALGILALMRWNALNRYSSFVDDSSNEFIEPQEKHFKNLRQLTFSGENAEAYFSSDSKKLIFQGHDGDGLCDEGDAGYDGTVDPDPQCPDGSINPEGTSPYDCAGDCFYHTFGNGCDAELSLEDQGWECFNLRGNDLDECYH